MPPQLPFAGRAPRPTWRMTVVGARDVTPRMREISLIGDDLSAFTHRPGQDLVLNLPTEAGIARRHYTVRRFDPSELRLDIQFVLHGDAPAARWAREARHGDGLIAEGPRGRTVVNGPADWRLFTGDETALPGIAAMIESLPAGERAFAIIEVAGPDDEQPIETAAELELLWLHRGGAPVAPSQALIDALADFDLPRRRRPGLRDRRDLDGARPAPVAVGARHAKDPDRRRGLLAPRPRRRPRPHRRARLQLRPRHAPRSRLAARVGVSLCALPRVERGGAGARGPNPHECHHKSSTNNGPTSRLGRLFVGRSARASAQHR